MVSDFIPQKSCWVLKKRHVLLNPKGTLWLESPRLKPSSFMYYPCDLELGLQPSSLTFLICKMELIHQNGPVSSLLMRNLHST